MPVKDYRELEIWKRGISLTEDVYVIAKTFPKEEIYCLTGQIRKSAISVPSNIAEGFARSNNNEYKQFFILFSWQLCRGDYTDSNCFEIEICN
jgi:hypothetical protein